MRFRCVLCWALVPWSRGCADQLELSVSRGLDQRVWQDKRVSDGGVCDDCWCALDDLRSPTVVITGPRERAA